MQYARDDSERDGYIDVGGEPSEILKKPTDQDNSLQDPYESSLAAHLMQLYFFVEK